MAAFSDYLEAGVLDHTLRGVALSAPAAVYLALFTTDPTDAGGGVEVADSAYAREDMADGGAIASGWTAPAVDTDGYAVTNAKVIQYPPIADGTVTVTHYGLFDAATAGNLLYHGAFTSSKTLDVNDVMSIAVGGLKIILR